MSDELIQTKECRICFEGETDEEDPLIAPCLCNGTSKYIHVSCLNNWRHFNENNRAWTHCMECGGEYTIINNLPFESTTHYKYLSKKINIFIQNYLINFFLSYLIYYLDLLNNYALINTLNFGLDTPEPTLLSIVKKETLSPQIFYFSFSVFIFNIPFYIYFYYVKSFKIFRKKEYYDQVKGQYYLSIFYSSSFLIFYYFFIFTGLTVTYLNFITLQSICEPYIIYKLIKKHNETITFLNNNTSETIVSFENRENPAYNIELTNDNDDNNNISENRIIDTKIEEQIYNDSDEEIEIDIFVD